MISTLEDALEELLYFSEPRQSGHVALVTVAEALDALGNPHESLRAIHIAGTSGKTSTAYFLRRILEDSGMRTGLTVSPHITAINERVQIGGVPLDERAFCAYVSAAIARLEPMRGRLTYFELTVALALWVFACEKVDYAIVEVGIGGTRDATNIMRRPDKVSVIGQIGLDHTEKLGNTIEEIAKQKAGILVPDGIGFAVDQSPRALGVIRSTADQLRATLHVVRSSSDVSGVAALFQWENWMMAAAVARFLAERDGFNLPGYIHREADLPSPERVAEVENVLLDSAPPARYEWFRIGAHRVLLDGAHNPQKAAGLVTALAAGGMGRMPVLANLSIAPHDKIVDTLSVLEPIVERLIVPEFELGHDTKTKRCVPAEELVKIARGMGMDSEAVPDLEEAVEALLGCGGEIHLVTGSLYLSALVRPILRRLEDNVGEERRA